MGFSVYTLCCAVSVAVLVLGGCALPRSPHVSVSDARWSETTEEGGVLSFTLDLENPAEQPYELREVRYDLVVRGRRVYSGRRAPLATLPGSRSQRIDLPAVILYGQLPDAPASGGTAAFDYELSGSVLYVAPDHIAEILLDTGVRQPRVRFSDHGTVAPASR